MDAKKFAELLEQADAGQDLDLERAGDTDALLAVAQGLKSLAPPPALAAETEHRIFAKMQALAPELDLELEHAYGIDEELAAVADGLKSLAPAALSAESEERIFARVQEKMPELSMPPKRSLAPKLGRIAAFKPLGVQRKADAFAAMLDRAAAGQPVAATGQMSQLLAAASALSPLPAVQPSPSFVDWLEVRLTSPSAAAQPVRTRRSAVSWLASLNQGLSNSRLQGALAGAAAVLVAVAAFNLQDATSSQTQVGTRNSAAVAPKTPDGGLPQPSSDLSPEPEIVAAAPAAAVSGPSAVRTGTNEVVNRPADPRKPTPPTNGKNPPPPTNSAEQAEPGVQGELAATSYNQEKQIMDILRGPQ